MLEKATFWIKARPWTRGLIVAIFILIVADLLFVYLLPFLLGNVNNQPYKSGQYGYGLSDPLLAGVVHFLQWVAGVLERHEKLLIVAATITIAWFTGTLWRATDRLWQAGEKQIGVSQKAADAAKLAADANNAQARFFKSAERAYVKISHRDPGIRMEEDSDCCEIIFEVRNWGRTPGEVTDVVIGYKLLEFGKKLDVPYPFSNAERESFPNAFLVANEAFFISKHIKKSQFLNVDKQLWVFGYVDYIDAFGDRWRGGYARKFVDQKGNNLVYNTESRENFDHKRKKPDGQDWPQKQPPKKPTSSKS